MSHYDVQALERLSLVTSRRHTLRYFFLLLIPLGSIVLALFAAYEFNRYQHYQTRLVVSQEKNIGFAHSLLTRDLRVALSDVLILTHSGALSRYLADPSERTRRELSERFLIFAKDRRLYDQIRYLDRQGRELVRINFNDGAPGIVERHELQDKGARYYLAEAQTLGEGELYLSELDLNVEHGQIEQPFKPVLRVVSPVFDAQSRRSGWVVVNYRAQNLLDDFKSVVQSESGALVQLLNRDGYRVSHPDAAKEWAFMFGDSGSFADEAPDIWRSITRQQQGRIDDQDRTYLFKAVSPAQFAVPSVIKSGAEKTDTRLWYIVTEIPREGFWHYLKSHSVDEAWLLVSGLLLVAAYSWFYARRLSHSSQWRALTALMYHSVEQGPSAVLITDLAGRIRYANRAFEELTGYQVSEVLGRRPTFLGSGHYSKSDYQLLWQTISSGSVWQGEVRNKRKDGSFYWADERISPILDTDGAITHYVGVQVDTTEKQGLMTELSHLATHDGLTGVLNRAAFEKRVGEDLNRAIRYRRELTMIMLDIDHFKRVNDEYGHKAGDAVLKTVAGIISACCRSTDYVGRYGGEEFVIALPEASAASALMSAERLRAELEAAVIHVGGNETLQVTASIGLATFPEQGQSVGQLTAVADAAMYEAKRAGRNRVHAAC